MPEVVAVAVMLVVVMLEETFGGWASAGGIVGVGTSGLHSL